MKKLIIGACFILLPLLNSSGQWYVKKYSVNNINLLTKEQLVESLKKAKNGLLGSAFITGFGALLIVIPFSPSESPTFFEQLIGPEGERLVPKVFGVVLVAGGCIGAIVFIERTAQIKAVLKNNYPGTAHIRLAPVLNFNHFTGSYAPGIGICCKF